MYKVSLLKVPLKRIAKVSVQKQKDEFRSPKFRGRVG